MSDDFIHISAFRCYLLLVLVIQLSLSSCDGSDTSQMTHSVHYTDSTIVFHVNDNTFTMILVEGGTFEMGATAEQEQNDSNNGEYPVHVVNLSSYYICQTEVTQELWTAVMGTNPSRISGEEMLPVDCVKWDMCQEFISALNEIFESQFEIRMPTEAEWEFAARGGNKSKGYKYSGSNNPDEVAWYCDNSGGTTHHVATKKPNELGIYDMSGNLWEWCQDWLGHYHAAEETDPIGPETGGHRVMRSGSWSYDQDYCRVSNRNFASNVIGVSNCGLRLAMTCSQTSK